MAVVILAVEVGVYFDFFGVNGREEVDLDRFVSLTTGSQAAFEAFQAANPYK